mmetsp:Transcript_18475/g.52227  ORF Transcript_18475/g.52227 Transcript_18475/m.52227 type:complete len:248 (+) Transcript_18475:1908-2651(+)
MAAGRRGVERSSSSPRRAAVLDPRDVQGHARGPRQVPHGPAHTPGAADIVDPAPVRGPAERLRHAAAGRRVRAPARPGPARDRRAAESGAWRPALGRLRGRGGAERALGEADGLGRPGLDAVVHASAVPRADPARDARHDAARVQFRAPLRGHSVWAEASGRSRGLSGRPLEAGRLHSQSPRAHRLSGQVLHLDVRPLVGHHRFEDIDAHQQGDHPGRVHAGGRLGSGGALGTDQPRSVEVGRVGLA